MSATGASPPLRMALLGNPNCGKTALFNRLTGSRQKVGNYAGVTVDVRHGTLRTPGGRNVTVMDLPGTYSLHPGSDDERLTCAVVAGTHDQDPAPDLVAVVLDATRLRRGLRLVAALQRTGQPMVVLLNMMDRVLAQGRQVDAQALQRVLGVPVIEATGIRRDGTGALRAWLDSADAQALAHAPIPVLAATDDLQAQHWLMTAGLDAPLNAHGWSRRLDAWLLHPLLGGVVLLAVLFLMFQAVFAWAEAPMGWIEDGTALVGDALVTGMQDGLLRSLLVDGVVAGLGGVLVFLPQILILFLFILVLEESGYLPRAALLLDRWMHGLGLSGRSFIPLLSGFACAIPGILAARTIPDRRARWVTILIMPLMTCSARLPVYALLIGAFVPARTVLGLELQGLVLFGLYALGMAVAALAAWLLRWSGAAREESPLMMELPDYHWPRWPDIALGLWQRASVFVRNVGGIILALTVLLWFLSTFPQAPADHAGPAIAYSLAGHVGAWLQPFFAPIGFPWQVVVALVPALAAREVVVSALATVYAVAQTGDAVHLGLGPLLAQDWTVATGWSLLVWFVFAPQCLATFAVVRKEVGHWGLPVAMLAALFGLAYTASWLTYRLALAAGA